MNSMKLMRTTWTAGLMSTALVLGACTEVVIDDRAEIGGVPADPIGSSVPSARGEPGPMTPPIVVLAPPTVTCGSIADCPAPSGPLGRCRVVGCDPTGAHAASGIPGAPLGCYVEDAAEHAPCTTLRGCAGSCAGATGGGCQVPSPLPVACGGCTNDTDCGEGLACNVTLGLCE